MTYWHNEPILNKLICISDLPTNNKFYIKLRNSTWAPVGKECSLCRKTFEDPEEIVLRCYDYASNGKLRIMDFRYFHLSHWDKEGSNYKDWMENLSYLSRCKTAKELYSTYPQHKELVRKFLLLGGGIQIIWDFESFVKKGRNAFRKAFLSAIALNDYEFPLYFIDFIVRYCEKVKKTSIIEITMNEFNDILSKLLKVS